jgi:hypothetical protein
MNLNNYTQKSQETILGAQQIAHLLLALLTQEEGVAPAVVNKVVEYRWNDES